MTKAIRFDAIIASPIGKIGIVLNDKAVSQIVFLADSEKLIAPTIPFAKKVCVQLERYFANPKISLDFPLQLSGTPLQQKIWRQLQTIPRGETITYGALAKKIGTGPRVVGNACRKNPIPLIIPCHRVVAANGLGGFAGKTKGRNCQIKSWLLNHEGVRHS